MSNVYQQATDFRTELTQESVHMPVILLPIGCKNAIRLIVRPSASGDKSRPVVDRADPRSRLGDFGAASRNATRAMLARPGSSGSYVAAYRGSTPDCATSSYNPSFGKKMSRLKFRV